MNKVFFFFYNGTMIKRTKIMNKSWGLYVDRVLIKHNDDTLLLIFFALYCPHVSILILKEYTQI